MSEEKGGALRWLAYGEVGTSSKTIALRLLEFPNDNESHPLDPDDFLRCVRLLSWVPSFRDRLEEMKGVSQVWWNLVENWEDLEKLLYSEMAEGNSAPKTYLRMKELGC